MKLTVNEYNRFLLKAILKKYKADTEHLPLILREDEAVDMMLAQIEKFELKLQVIANGGMDMRKKSEVDKKRNQHKKVYTT